VEIDPGAFGEPSERSRTAIVRSKRVKGHAMSRFIQVLSVVLLVATPLSAGAGLRVTDEKLGVTLTLPDAFEAGAAVTPPPSEGQPAPLTFRRGQVGADSFAVLQLTPLRGTIGRDKIGRKIVEDSARAAVRGSEYRITTFGYETARWNAFELELVVGQVSIKGRRFVTLSTQVPLVRNALQISLMGPAEEEARLRAEFQATLSALVGESNWLNDQQRSERLGRIAGMAIGGLVGTGVVLAVMLRRQRRQRRA